MLLSEILRRLGEIPLGLHCELPQPLKSILWRKSQQYRSVVRATDYVFHPQQAQGGKADGSFTVAPTIEIRPKAWVALYQYMAL
jgi:hypothetical protein